MKPGICDICQKETNDLWLHNLAQIDKLSTVEGKNIRQSVCTDCATTLNQVVEKLVNETSMSKAFNKAGVKPHKNMGNSRGQTQNSFLNNLIEQEKLVQIESVEGIGWRGYLKNYDDFSILIISEQTKEEELIFKHAVKSIKPI